MPKIGRPLTVQGERQERLVALRLTTTEYDALQRSAERAGLSVSDYIRQILELRRRQYPLS